MSVRTHVPVIGLIGGVGSGKSRLAKWVSQQRSILIIDGDKIGHEILRDSAVQQQIRSRFGDSVFSAVGEVDRSALGREVFGADARKRQARRDLEALMHPAIRSVMAGRISEARSGGTLEAVLLDAAVLLEAGWDDLCDTVVFVDVPREIRMARVTQNRGWSEAEFDSRESSQFDLETKQKAARHRVDNSGPVERAGAQLLQILDETKNSHVNN